MEFEFDLRKLKPYRAGLAVLFIILTGLAGLVGWQVTANPPQLLTWTDWQVFKGERLYQRELAELQTEAEALVALLSQPPQPVRAQLTAEHSRRVAASGLPALAYQRTRLLQAAEAVEAWAVGSGTYLTAETAVQLCLQAFTGPGHE